MKNCLVSYRGLRVAGLAAGACLLVTVLSPAGTLQEKDDPPAAQQAAAAGPAPVKATAEPDQATLDQWRANIDKWKGAERRKRADNTYCYVCHAKYAREKLVKTHASRGVGCETCHGRSDKHSQDEDSLVPPDLMFSKAWVAGFCVQCHEKSDLLDSDESHRKLFAGELEPDKTCTSCHDIDHVMKVRTRRWNKETRKIEWYDGVRMMQSEEDRPRPVPAEGAQPSSR